MKRWLMSACAAFVFVVALQVSGFCYLANKIRHVEKNTNVAVENVENELLYEQLALMIADRKLDMRRFYVSDGYKSDDAYIAHGGGICQFTYTNSREAVENSLDRGFKFIEIDMIKTADNHIIGGHDWDYFSKITKLDYGKKGGALSLDDALRSKIKESMSPISGFDIDKLMNENSNFVLVTDKVSDYDLLLKEIPHPDRMIVEVFSPRDYLRALRAGVKYPAYCVWTPEHLKTAKEFGFPIVTMDANNFFRQQETIQMVQELHDSGVTILLFWTGYPDRDETDWLKKYLGRTVSKIYTDRWSPADKPE